MEKFNHREDPALFDKRLADASDESERQVLLMLLAKEDAASAAEVKIMNRRGIEFTLVQVEPGLWRWRFQIGDKVTTGNTRANLMGLATRRVQQRIDIELKKAVRPGFWQPNSASSPDAP